MASQLNILIFTSASTRKRIAVNCDHMLRFVEQDNGYTKVYQSFGAGEVVLEVTESFDDITRALELLAAHG